VLVAGAGIAVYQVAFFSAVEATGVGIGTVVAIGSGPVAAGVLERLLGGRWPGRRWAWSTALAALGVALLTLASTGEETIAPAGIALALVAGSGYAAYTVAVRRLVAGGQSPVAVMGASFGSGALILAPVLLLTDASWLARPSGAALALYLGVVPTALAYLLFARGLRHVGAAEATTIVLAEPVTAAALGAAVLDERVGPLGLLGAALVLAALLVLALPGRRRVGTIVAVARR
jgi:DME family drug/metabolite transporter